MKASNCQPNSTMRRWPGSDAFGRACPSKQRPSRRMTPDLAENRAKALALTPVSRETADKLRLFVDDVLDVSRHTNLTSRSSLPTIWTRHIADSLQLLPLAPEARCWVDLGSGGGFPGIVIACALADRPGVQVHLVESIGKKAAFLRHASARRTPQARSSAAENGCTRPVSQGTRCRG